MLIAFWIVVFLILSSLFTLFTDSPIIQGLISAAAAAGLFAGVWGLKPLEGNHIAKSIGWMLLAATLPAVWIAIQLIPVPIAIAHPIWASARDALGEPLSSHLTIDLGDTLIALGQYFTAIAVILSSSFVAIERRRAEWILFSLASVAAIAALVLIVDRLLGSTLITAISGSENRAPFQALAAVGVPLTATAIDRAIERYETRGGSGKLSPRDFFRDLSFCIAGFVICAVAVLYAAPIALVLAAACGVLAIGIVVSIRRFEFGKWVAGALTISAAIVGIVLAMSHDDRSLDLTLRYATNVPAKDISAMQRMVADNWLGSGAGTFTALVPIYSDSVTTTSLAPPSSAAKISTELGKPSLFVAILLVITMIGLLLHGSIRRGRDSFYAAGATGCLLTLSIEAFADASLFAPSVMTMAAVILGLGFAQRLSRTSH